MTWVVVFSQALLYLCFALLIGSFLLTLVPPTYRPTIDVSRGILMTATAGIAFFSFMPVLLLILYIHEGFGLFQSVQSVLFTFEVGKAWLFTFVISNALFIFLIWFDYRKKIYYAYIGLALTFILMLAVGWSSHASSYEQIRGLINHTVHLTAVSVWAGILLVTGWFSKNYENWMKFLKWFTPVAFVCLIAVISTGLMLMNVSVKLPEYPSSWMLSYGQSLLLKHILLLPLLVYALINSQLVRRRIRNDLQFNPIPWTKWESAVILFIFMATAVLGEQSPPHEAILTQETVSSLFMLFYQGVFQPGMTVQFVMNAVSISFFVLAFLFFGLMVLSFIKKASALVSFLLSVLGVMCVYLGMMFSLS